MPLIVRTLSDQICDVLRQRIVLHDIAPGDIIRQDALAAELGVSKIPVREALEGSGMVQSVTNRGFIASPLSMEEADDIFALRLLIEPATAAASALEAGDEQRAEVAEAHAHLMRDEGDFRDTMDARRRMVLSLLIREDRPTRTRIIIQLFDRAERYHPADPDPDFLGFESLKALISAWLKRDGAKVREVYEARLIARATQACAALER
jgi:DNA-binding GntR family transcriptional regulator